MQPEPGKWLVDAVQPTRTGEGVEPEPKPVQRLVDAAPGEQAARFSCDAAFQQSEADGVIIW
jgi:hypothetical protein